MTVDELVNHHAEEWERCIISAGGDENVAQQAVALAALNGLFDIHKDWAVERYGFPGECSGAPAPVGHSE